MRSYQIFAAMPPEQAEAFFATLNEKAAAVFVQAIHVASAAFKSRPQFLLKQPFEKRAASVRRALARVGCNTMAEEVLAVYFLECRKELLIEWLELLGIEHEDGILKEDEPAAPDDAKLREATQTFRAKDDDEARELLLRAFAAQPSIDWPTLDELTPLA